MWVRQPGPCKLSHSFRRLPSERSTNLDALGLLPGLSAHFRYPCLLKKVGKVFSKVFTACITSTSVFEERRYNVAKKNVKNEITMKIMNTIVQAGSSSPSSSFFKSALLPHTRVLMMKKLYSVLGLLYCLCSGRFFSSANLPRSQ